MPLHSPFRRLQARGLRHPLSRRQLLRQGFLGLGLIGLGATLSGCGNSSGSAAGPITSARGRLQIPPLASAPDENGLLIPQGFRSRVLAQANQPVAGTGFVWHTDPDAGAVYPAADGGWVYVSNREFVPGGVNALRFDAQGEITSAYTVLPGALSRINCGGGVTPWNTWLSGEEYELGLIWECDPFDTTGTAVQSWRGCGTFAHEAVAIDPASNIFYLTEDESDGRFYRFVPTTPNIGGRPSTDGVLEALQVMTAEDINLEGARGPWPVQWRPIPAPNPLGAVIEDIPLGQTPTRYQVPETTAFRGGEGLWFQNGIVYFTTKSDRRVWAHDVAAGTLEVIYDDAFFQPEPVLDSVDNIVMTPGGDIVVVEDKSEANQQAVAILADGRLAVLVQLVGHEGSEVTGPAFSPDGRFFYCSSQRGPGNGNSTGTAGITYAIEGPWFRP